MFLYRYICALYQRVACVKCNQTSKNLQNTFMADRTKSTHQLEEGWNGKEPTSSSILLVDRLRQELTNNIDRPKLTNRSSERKVGLFRRLEKMCAVQCFRSGSARIRLKKCLPDPDPGGKKVKEMYMFIR